MNVDTGHLKKVANGDYVSEEYTLVPEHLLQEARNVLNGQNETYVNLNSNSKLSQWAKQKRKSKNKMAKQSRKNNRRK